MSAHTKSLFRNYLHRVCRGVTKVSGDDYVMLENPFRDVSGTYCAVCQKAGPLEEFVWSDTGQPISDYRKEIAAGVSAGEKTRLSTAKTIYEGALRLHLDRDGNPIPGAPNTTAAARILGDTDIVTRSPLPDDQAQIVAAMHELTAALSECVPAHFTRIRCQLRMLGAGAARKLSVRISNPDRPEEMPTPSPRVDQTAAQLVQVMNPSSGPFPGLTVNMERLEDGRWHNNVKLKQN